MHMHMHTTTHTLTCCIQAIPEACSDATAAAATANGTHSCAQMHRHTHTRAPGPGGTGCQWGAGARRLGRLGRSSRSRTCAQNTGPSSERGVCAHILGCNLMRTFGCLHAGDQALKKACVHWPRTARSVLVVYAVCVLTVCACVIVVCVCVRVCVCDHGVRAS